MPLKLNDRERREGIASRSDPMSKGQEVRINLVSPGDPQGLVAAVA